MRWNLTFTFEPYTGNTVLTENFDLVGSSVEKRSTVQQWT